jgi:hypothetical protein
MATQRGKAINAIQKRLNEHGWTDELSDIVRDRPWLLNPAWTRTTQSNRVGEIARLKLEEIRDSSLLHGQDKVIAVKQSSGVDLVAFQPVSIDIGNELLERIQTYQEALKQAVVESGSERLPSNIVVVVSRDARGDFNDGLVERMDAVVYSYEELLEAAKLAYKKQREQDRSAGRVTKLVQEIKSGDAFE